MKNLSYFGESSLDWITKSTNYICTQSWTLTEIMTTENVVFPFHAQYLFFNITCSSTLRRPTLEMMVKPGHTRAINALREVLKTLRKMFIKLETLFLF
jgi:hypothetical protein